MSVIVAIKENDVEAMNEANGELDSALSRLLVVVENYPELKANQNWMKSLLLLGKENAYEYFFEQIINF